MDKKSARSSGTWGSTAFAKCTRRRGTKQHPAIECDLAEFGEVKLGDEVLARRGAHFDLDDVRSDGFGCEFERNDSAAQGWAAIRWRCGAFDGISRDDAWLERFLLLGKFESKALPEILRIKLAIEFGSGVVGGTYGIVIGVSRRQFDANLQQERIAAAKIIDGGLLRAVTDRMPAGIGDDLRVWREQMDFRNVWAFF